MRTMSFAVALCLLQGCGEVEIRVEPGNPPRIVWDSGAMNSLSVVQCDISCDEDRGTCRESGTGVWDMAVGLDGKGYFGSPQLYGEPPSDHLQWEDTGVSDFNRGRRARPLVSSSSYSVNVALYQRTDEISYKAIELGKVCFSGISYTPRNTPCLENKKCQTEGKCTYKSGTCVATAEVDCKASYSCKDYGMCRLGNGTCIK